MGLEDMAMFRAIPTATIFYPSDGVSTEKAVELAACTKVCETGVHYNPYLGSTHCILPLRTGCLLHPHQLPGQRHHLQQQRGLPRGPG